MRASQPGLRYSNHHLPIFLRAAYDEHALNEHKDIMQAYKAFPNRNNNDEIRQETTSIVAEIDDSSKNKESWCRSSTLTALHIRPSNALQENSATSQDEYFSAPRTNIDSRLRTVSKQIRRCGIDIARDGLRIASLWSSDETEDVQLFKHSLQRDGRSSIKDLLKGLRNKMCRRGRNKTEALRRSRSKLENVLSRDLELLRSANVSCEKTATTNGKSDGSKESVGQPEFSHGEYRSTSWREHVVHDLQDTAERRIHEHKKKYIAQDDGRM